MSTSKILKIRLGNNPTSSATTYQLMPDIYAAVTVAVLIVWAVLATGFLGAVAALARIPRSRKSGADVSVFGGIAAGLVFTARNLRLVLKTAFKASFVCIPANLFLAASLLILLFTVADLPAFQVQIVLIAYILVACMTPAWIIGGAIGENLKAGKTGTSGRDGLKKDVKPLALSTFFAFLFAVFVPFLVRRPEVSKVYGTLYEVEPLRPGSPASADPKALVFCLALIGLLAAAYIMQVIVAARKTTIVGKPPVGRVIAAFIMSFSLNLIVVAIMIGGLAVMVLLGVMLSSFGPAFGLLGVLLVSFSANLAIAAGAVIPAVSIVFACLAPSDLEALSYELRTRSAVSPPQP